MGKTTKRNLRAKRKKRLRNNRELIELRINSSPSEKEAEIMQILARQNINFIRERHFNDLFNPATGKFLFFDFYLPDYNAVIEYDGIHHYKPIKGDKELISQQLKDNIKNLYCRRNGLKMLRIPYWKKDIELEVCKFFDKHF